MSKVQKGTLQEAARSEPGVDPDQSYQELRDAIDIKECKRCGSEFVSGWRGKYCTEKCEVMYLDENF